MKPPAKFSDLPSSHGRYEIVLPIGVRQDRRTLKLFWQRGESLHPCLAVTAMVHGDEFEGFAASLSFWQDLQARRVNDSVLILPVCNPYAAESATRPTLA